MQSLQQSFDELRQQLKQGRGINHTSDDPVYYLVFRPEKMQLIKQIFNQWKARLELEEWSVHTFSMADAVKEILTNDSMREVWLESEAYAPFEFQDINSTLSDALTSSDRLQNMLEEKIKSLSGVKNAILFVTDLEALHPYLRVGSLEQRLQGRFAVPTIILYPGTRSGRTTLKFLGIYPDDGNYRSMHIGKDS